MAVYRPQYKDRKTGKTKHTKIWYYEFIFAGRLVKESAKTTSKTVAKQAEQARRRELEKGSTAWWMNGRSASETSENRPKVFWLRTRSGNQSLLRSPNTH
jgi:hypothetical protein